MDIHTIYLSLGSNMGNRLSNLKQALLSLPPQIDVVARSDIYETPPWGYTKQDPFLNQAVKAETYLEPVPLLKHIKRLEVVLGREKNFQYGPRSIDIDILFYDDLLLATTELIIPHPNTHERAFVLVPLMDIAPDLVHPVKKTTVREMKALCDTSGINKFA